MRLMTPAISEAYSTKQTVASRTRSHQQSVTCSIWIASCYRLVRQSMMMRTSQMRYLNNWGSWPVLSREKLSRINYYKCHVLVMSLCKWSALLWTNSKVSILFFPCCFQYMLCRCISVMEDLSWFHKGMPGWCSINFDTFIWSIILYKYQYH